MDTFERNAARNLAVSYNAYLEASLGNQPIERIRTWARLLLRCQRETGIELIDTDRLLYPASGPSKATVEILRDGVEGDAAPEGADSRLDAFDRMSNDYQAAKYGPDDGGALVPSPKPLPRKPSPGASVASQAAAFYARAR